MDPLLLVGIAVAICILIIVLMRRGSSTPPSLDTKIGESPGVVPDYVWRGKLFLSLEDAARRAGAGGAKVGLAIYKSQHFVRLSFDSKEVYHFIHVAFVAKSMYDIPFNEIGEITRVFTPLNALVVGVRHENLSANELTLHGDDLSTLRDMLREAVKDVSEG